MRSTMTSMSGASVTVIALIVGYSSGLQAADIVAEFDAGRFEQLAVSAGKGSVRVSAVDGDTIHVTVELESDDGWFSDEDESDLDDARIASTELASTLRLRIDLPRGFDEDDVEEHWKIQIPAHMQTKLRIGVGMIEVRDTSGDVEAHAGVGEVDIDVLSGNVRAHTSVGDVQVRSQTKSTGDIAVDSDVGNAYVRVDGKRYETRRGWGPGASVSIDRDGDDQFKVTADVGNAGLVIEGG